MKLEDFVDEMKNDIEEFEEWWIEENKKNPEHFPMEFKKNNEGLWLEMFLSWQDTK
jgi:hypothetical protein